VPPCLLEPELELPWNGGNIENHEIERGDTGWRETNLCTRKLCLILHVSRINLFKKLGKMRLLILITLKIRFLLENLTRPANIIF